MLCLSPVLPGEDIVIGLKKPIKRREPFRINGAAMRFPTGHALLKEASTFLNANLTLIGSSWRSVAGPDLLTRLVPQYGIKPREISLFYPIGGPGSWDFCDPAKRDEVAAAVSDSPMIHLWQERFRAAGLPRDKLPPAGSFLAEAFTNHGGAGAPSLSQEDLRRFAPEKRAPSVRDEPTPRVSMLSAIRRIIGV